MLLVFGVYVVAAFFPGDPSPKYEVPTLSGYFTGPPKGSPLVVHAANPSNLYSTVITSNPTSLRQYLEIADNTTHVAFLSWSPSAHNYSVTLRDAFHVAMVDLKWSQERRLAAFQRLHFVNQSIDRLADMWMSQLLQAWTFNATRVVFASGGTTRDASRVDAGSDLTQYTFFHSNPKKYNILPFSCPNPIHRNYTGAAVLVARAECGDNFTAVLSEVRRWNASGVVMYTSKTQNVVDMVGDGGDGIPIAATMISYADGQEVTHMLATGAPVTATFDSPPTHGVGFAIDGGGTLREIGWFRFPGLSFFEWEGQWLQYKLNLEERIATTPAVVVPLFRSVFLGPTDHGAVSVSPKLPPAGTFQKSDVYLDMQLGCPGHFDAECPIWDRTLRLHVQCKGGPGRHEVGQWITPFRRKVGRWLTDVGPITPLFTTTTGGPSCNFTLSTDPWVQKPWMPTVALRLVPKKEAPTIAPTTVLPVYEGTFPFNSSYESYFPRTTFNVPDGVVKVLVRSVITGHGSDENGCGEFCATEHHIAVNQRHYLKNFSLPDLHPVEGCTLAVASGSVPNEHGTWLYGRDGWCDGEAVTPWDITVTTAVRPGVNDIAYTGTYHGAVPKPKQGGAVMIVSMYVVFYTAVDGSQ